MSHPCNYSSFRPLLDRDAFRPGDRAASDRRRMLCDGFGEPVSEIGVSLVKGQERYDRSQEIFNVFSLRLLSSSGIGFLLLGETLGGSLDFEVGTNTFNRRR